MVAKAVVTVMIKEKRGSNQLPLFLLIGLVGYLGSKIALKKSCIFLANKFGSLELKE